MVVGGAGGPPPPRLPALAADTRDQRVRTPPFLRSNCRYALGMAKRSKKSVKKSPAKSGARKKPLFERVRARGAGTSARKTAKAAKSVRTARAVKRAGPNRKTAPAAKSGSLAFDAVVQPDDRTTMCGIELPGDPRDTWGKARVPVVARIGGHSYRTTVCAMGGSYWIPLRKSNREAAGVEAGQKVRVVLDLDDQPREVEAPRDLLAALGERPGALDAWKALSFTHQREHVEAIEDARKPETRERRIANAVKMVADRSSR